MSKSKYKLYGTVKCNSPRPELAAIAGKQVGIIAIHQSPNQRWEYIVAADSKGAPYFQCMESELGPAEKSDAFADLRTYPTIRRALGGFLHQDFDFEFNSVADAIHAAVKHAEKRALILELSELEKQSDETIAEVLGDHDVDLWNCTTPRELLVTMKTLANLCTPTALC